MSNALCYGIFQSSWIWFTSFIHSNQYAEKVWFSGFSISVILTSMNTKLSCRVLSFSLLHLGNSRFLRIFYIHFLIYSKNDSLLNDHCQSKSQRPCLTMLAHHPFLNFWTHFPVSSPCKIVYLKNFKNWARKGYGKCIEQNFSASIRFLKPFSTAWTCRLYRYIF